MKRRVLFVAGREMGYMRNRVLLQALRLHHDVEVVSSSVRGTIPRSIATLATLAVRRPAYDLCLAGFFGQPLAIALSHLQRRPVVLDAFVSTYDTLVDDRQRFTRRSAAGRLAWWLDSAACAAAAHVLTDAQAGADYFSTTFGVPPRKLTPVYVGCDEALFYPRPPSPAPARCEVFYYGAFLPLHGTDIILKAAALLQARGAPVHFVIGGDGPLHRDMRALAVDLCLENAEFPGWIPVEQLPSYIARVTLCLGGHFSRIPKAARVRLDQNVPVHCHGQAHDCRRWSRRPRTVRAGWRCLRRAHGRPERPRRCDREAGNGCHAARSSGGVWPGNVPGARQYRADR